MYITIQQLKQLINEQLLCEVSLQQAKQGLSSKKTINAITQWIESTNYSKSLADVQLAFVTQIMWFMPRDVDDKQKALALMWLIREARLNRQFLQTIIYIDDEQTPRHYAHDLEQFFTGINSWKSVIL